MREVASGRVITKAGEGTMTDYKAICSDCPKCGEETIVLLAYSFRVRSVEAPTPKRMTCNLNYAQIHGSRRSGLPNRVAGGHPNGDALKARRS